MKVLVFLQSAVLAFSGETPTSTAPDTCQNGLDQAVELAKRAA